MLQVYSASSAEIRQLPDLIRPGERSRFGPATAMRYRVAKLSGRLQLEGRYANCFEIGYNDAEFVVDFGQQYGSGEPLYHTRIVTSPAYVKEFLELLSNSFAEYQASYRGDEGGGA